MPSQTECKQGRSYEFAGDNVRIFNKPLKKYFIDFGEYVHVAEATNMTTNDHGIVFEDAIIRDKDGKRIGIGRTFIEHSALVGVTLIEEEFGELEITNETKLSLFGIGE